MYSALTLLKKYLHYYATASNSKGHGMHSPFVFQFITQLLNDKNKPVAFEKIEQLRRQLKQDDRVLQIEDFGAGSTVTKSNTRKVGSIARTALKPAKYGQLMHRMVKYYSSATVVELGTSLGLTSSYLASANPATKVFTMEGSGKVAKVALENFKKLGLQNIELVQGNFDETLEPLLQRLPVIDLGFVDGNHRKEPTIRYFEMLLTKANEYSIFIFDDIHWSKEMEEAWHYIQHHSSVTLTIDLFFIGIVFFRKEQLIPQHFAIRY
ncbi:O-methyltransferase [Aridibaculum aurantiacum]|uniref:O-methyltransferase n=1 Tax=Aridibaculum aurantiacum TaxID=2810307 RepID=UPI001A958ECA|nr:class I SAM-dependent methyltransferase [Aridibaculum aurantiacum]